METWVQGLYSKINWTQVVASLAMLLAFVSGGKVGLDASQQAAVIVVIGVVFNIITWILRTWFSPTITPLTPTGVLLTAAKDPNVEKIVVKDPALADAVPSDKVVAK